MVGCAGGGSADAAGFQTLAVAAATSLQRSSQVESVAPQSPTLMSTDRRAITRSGKILLDTSQTLKQATKGDNKSSSTRD